jgi:RNA polymerase-binding transcription factor DksA
MDDVDRTTERLLAEQSLREAAQAQRISAPIHDGPCQSCGDEIEPARKTTQPWALRCTDCQTRFEARQKQYRRSL